MNLFSRVFRFYRDGFASMTIGKSLWLIIIIKVAIMFLVLKLFFFPNFLKEKSEETGLTPNDLVKETLLDRTSR